MCKYKVLELNDDGYVVRCPGCAHLQVVFGNVATVFTENQFYLFKNMIREHWHEYRFDAERRRKSIYLPTPVESVFMVLSPAELQSLNTMLEKAHISWEIEKLLVIDKK